MLARNFFFVSAFFLSLLLAQLYSEPRVPSSKNEFNTNATREYVPRTPAGIHVNGKIRNLPSVAQLSTRVRQIGKLQSQSGLLSI